MIRSTQPSNVALVVVKDFTAKVRERALGDEVNRALNPAQQFVYNIVLPAQSTIPSQVIEVRFATSVANQRELNLQIAVGDTDGVAPNQVEILGESLLKVPPGRPANSPLRVVFSADIDGMIHIQLIDLTDGISLGEMEVKRPSGMSPDQVERARIKLQAAEFT